MRQIVCHDAARTFRRPMVYGTSGQKASTSTNGGQYESLCSGSGHFGGCRISPSGVSQLRLPPYGYGYKATAPLYDYAGPASSAPVPTAPHKYGSLISLGLLAGTRE